MKYLVLIYSNPDTRKIWDSMSEQDRGVGWRAYAALDEELRGTGELVVSEALEDPSHGRRPVPSDGPFAEVKEHLAGFFLLDCRDMDRAMEIAAKIPEAPYGVVEVRPVKELG